MYSQPGPYPPQQTSEGTPYYQPGAYPPPPQPDSAPYYQPGAYPPPPQPDSAPYYQQSPYPSQQQATNYGLPQQAGGMPYYQPGPYPPQQVYMTPQFGMAGNPRAKRAMINGFISLGLSLITLFTLVGYAGVITGTFAIVYGFMGLNQSTKLPNNVGRAQAITGIVLGFVAWFFVILSLMMQMAQYNTGG